MEIFAVKLFDEFVARGKKKKEKRTHFRRTKENATTGGIQCTF